MSGVGAVLVAGATGAVGRKVVAALRARGRPVRALVRPGTDATAIEAPGVAIVRGDLLDRASLDRALDGVDAVVAAAAGYTKRRRADTAEVDVVGNRNLADAARGVRVRRFVFCSILNCHDAPDVPHFGHKRLAEEYLERLGLPFVALRPGAFLDQSDDYLAAWVKQGRFFSFGDATTRWTHVYTVDLARYLAEAVDAAGVEGERIDIGWDRPVCTDELAALAGGLVGRPMRVRTMPWWLLDPALRVASAFDRSTRDFAAMIRYFGTGRYVADPTRQAEVFGPAPRAEDAIARWLRAQGALPAPGCEGRPHLPT